jgi:hypothetical protein
MRLHTVAEGRPLYPEGTKAAGELPGGDRASVVERQPWRNLVASELKQS